MNPILSKNEFIPDAEAHRFSDGRIYLYGSRDTVGESTYCSRQYKVFSSADMKNWADHGISFCTLDDDTPAAFRNQMLYAPDCIEKDGRYYLYFCTMHRGEGVAVSNTPFGPFRDAKPIIGAHTTGIDPAIFIDDDGQAYLYWDQFHAQGARLKENMCEIDEDSHIKELLSEEEHGFHEGSSMRKRNGIYYFIYADISRGRPTCLSYATSTSPLGPFQKGGVIIDNTGCDPESWNNHGSIAEFSGQWYVFYHRSTHNSPYSRRVCVEPITFNEDGSINEVEMTTQGALPPLSPLDEMDAGRACFLKGRSYIEQSGDDEYIRVMHNGDAAFYKYFNFDCRYSHFEITATAPVYGASIELRADGTDGPLLGVCQISPTQSDGQWKTFDCSAEQISGIHALCLVFKAIADDEVCRVKSFRFVN